MVLPDQTSHNNLLLQFLQPKQPDSSTSTLPEKYALAILKGQNYMSVKLIHFRVGTVRFCGTGWALCTSDNHLVEVYIIEAGV